MDRRNFLSWLGVAPVAGLTPPLPLPEKPVENVAVPHSSAIVYVNCCSTASLDIERFAIYRKED
jgi:hypothetical protein